MTEPEQLRLNMIQDSQTCTTKRRFALFSQPLSIAVGDNGAYKNKVHPRDPATNKPMTKPRNFQTSPIKSGRGNSGYFQQLKSLATSPIKDEYLEEGKRLMKQQKQKRDKGKNQDVSFFTGAGNKLLSSSAYQYKCQNNPQRDPKSLRTEDGRVKSELKNVTTNPHSKVNTSYFKVPEYKSDPYERKHQLQVQREKKNRALELEARFRPNSFVPQKLNSDKKLYEEDVELKKQPEKQLKLNIMEHENRWKSPNPNKSGLYGYLAPFPQYKQNPPKETKRKEPKEGKKEEFKLNSSLHTSSPSASVSLNRTNIMRSMGRRM